MPLPQHCPLCASDHTCQNVVTRHVYGAQHGQAIFHCGQCDVRYLYPGLSAEEEARLYAAEFEKFMADRSAENAGWEKPESHISANAREAKRRGDFLSQHLPKSGRVLEIGCSSGFMLYDLAQKGFECVGVEPSGVFSEYVASRGLSCFNSLEALIENGTHQGGFDVILHYYVMEHISDPKTFLNEQLELLNHNGVLVFEVPNAMDALSDLYEVPSYEKFIWVISHQWYFSRPSMAHLLKSLDADFDVFIDQRYDLSNHMTWALDNRPGGMGRFTEIWGQEIEEQYKQALIKAEKGDTLTMVVRKT